jgi:hypothetical protein
MLEVVVHLQIIELHQEQVVMLAQVVAVKVEIQLEDLLLVQQILVVGVEVNTARALQIM